MGFKDVIKILRQEKGLSQAQLAVAFNKSESAIRTWETGRNKPDADTLILLARYFDCSIDYLLGYTEAGNLDTGNRIKALRKEKGITIHDIAEISGLSSTAISNYERGLRSPDAETIIKLAKFFECSTDHLLGLTDAKNTDDKIRIIESNRCLEGILDGLSQGDHDYLFNAFGRFVDDYRKLDKPDEWLALISFYKPVCNTANNK